MLAAANFMLLGLPFQVIEADALFLRTKKGTLLTLAHQMGRVIPSPIGDAHNLTCIQRLDIIDGAPIPVIREMRVWHWDRHDIRPERRDTVAARKARAWPGDPVRPSSTPFGAESLRGSIVIRLSIPVTWSKAASTDPINSRNCEVQLGASEVASMVLVWWWMVSAIATSVLSPV